MIGACVLCVLHTKRYFQRFTNDFIKRPTMSFVDLCEKGDLEGVRAALKRGVDVNMSTGLKLAVINNHNSVVELLLLHLAVNREYCLRGLTQAVWDKRKLLLNSPNIDLNLCFVYLCEQGNLEGVKAALERGADVNATDENGQTGLMLALRNRNRHYSRSSHDSVVELLLKTPNIDVNQKDKRGFCALREAVSKKNFRLLILLLNSPNIDVNIVSNNGGSAIYWAVERNSPFSLNWLLNKAPGLTALTINQKNGRPVKKNSPVMLAVKRHARNCLEVLATDPRVDLDTTDKAGRGLEEVAALAGLDWINIPRRHRIERWIFIEHSAAGFFWYLHSPIFLHFSGTNMYSSTS